MADLLTRAWFAFYRSCLLLHAEKQRRRQAIGRVKVAEKMLQTVREMVAEELGEEVAEALWQGAKERVARSGRKTSTSMGVTRDSGT